MKRLIIGMIVLFGLGMVACGNTQRKQEKESPAVVQEKKKRSFQLPEVPVMLDTPEARAAFVCEHYWDHFDFADTAYIHLPDITEQAIVNFMDLMPRVPQELADKALIVIPERVKEYAPKVGVTYGRITIRNQRTRWGSCSSKGNLNFNCLLMLFPDEVIDYVVVHELCHRKHMNHSAAFYAEVARVFPEYRKYQKWLKENGGLYLARLR